MAAAAATVAATATMTALVSSPSVAFQVKMMCRPRCPSLKPYPSRRTGRGLGLSPAIAVVLVVAFAEALVCLWWPLAALLRTPLAAPSAVAVIAATVLNIPPVAVRVAAPAVLSLSLSLL